MSVQSKPSTTRVQELIDAFEIIQPNWSGHDGRSSSRVQLCAPIVITPVSKKADSTFAVLMHDLSESGLGFLHVSALKPGQRFAVEKHPGFPVTRVFTVVHCQPHEDGRFRVGGKFDEALDDHKRLRDEIQRYAIAKSILS